MSLKLWMFLIGSFMNLGIAMVALWRSNRLPLARPLAYLCVVMFGWSFAHWVHMLMRTVITNPGPIKDLWGYVDNILSPFVVPTGMHFILAFIGERRRRRHLLFATYTVFGTFSLVTAISLFTDWGKTFAGRDYWSNSYLVIAVPFAVYQIRLLMRYLFAQINPKERFRAWIVLFAYVIAAVLGFIDLSQVIDDLLVPSTIPSVVLLAVVGLRPNDASLAFLGVTYIAALLFLSILGLQAVLAVLSTNMAVLVVVTLIITVVLIAIIRQTLSIVRQHNQQLTRMALMGRFASQMSHDVKNPLSTLKGAAQLLKREHGRNRRLDDFTDVMDIIVKESERMGEMIEKYSRLGQLEPTWDKIQVNHLIQSAISLPQLSESTIELVLDLDQGLEEISADGSLLVTALENVIVNACQAMAEGGRLTITTRGFPHRTEAITAVQIKVGDTGKGMDTQTREAAFDDFFTTKATGSGIGLSFVKRVIEAHQGSIELSTQLGRGTTITMRLPVEPKIPRSEQC